MNHKGKRIRTLEQLAAAAKNRQSIITKHYRWKTGEVYYHRQPAAWVINTNGSMILYQLQRGMFLYIPKKPQDHSKPPRGGRKPKPAPPKPILNLPYYPNLQPSH